MHYSANIRKNAGMVKLVDTADSKSAGFALASSSLATSIADFYQSPRGIVKAFYFCILVIIRFLLSPHTQLESEHGNLDFEEHYIAAFCHKGRRKRECHLSFHWFPACCSRSIDNLFLQTGFRASVGKNRHDHLCFHQHDSLCLISTLSFS